MSRFTDTPLQVEPLHGDKYMLLRTLPWMVNYPTVHEMVFIKAGFVTDWDTTPWFLKPLKIIKGRLKAKKAFALHDWGFRCGVIHVKNYANGRYMPVAVDDIDFWNQQMYNAIIAEGGGIRTAKLMRWGVSSFIGRRIWAGHKQRRQAAFNQATKDYYNENI